MASTDSLPLQSAGGAGLSSRRLRMQNRRYAGTGGVSGLNHALGFRPAFLDPGTGTVYLSRFADGRPAPVHVLDGLPADLLARRAGAGTRTASSATVTAGFVCNGHFYTRREAADFAARAARG